MQKNGRKSEQSGVQAVDRALLLLKLVANQGRMVSVGALCEQTGLNRSTVWRLMTSLERNGFVEKDSDSKEYQLGVACIGLCTGSYRQYEPLIRLIRPFLEELWRESLETIVLSVPRFGGMLSIEQLDSPQAIRVRNYLDEVDPLHCSSNGKVLLSYLPDEELKVLLNHPLEKRTEKTVIDPRDLWEEIEFIRENQYCIVQGEYDENENGMSMPLLSNGAPVAVFNVCGPSFRLTRERMLFLLPKMRAVREKIESALAAVKA